jgi:epoxyqueuosine reductase QueG
LTTREELAFPSLLDLQSFSQARWEEWAQGTPLRRLTFSRFQRNLEALLAASQEGPAAFSKEST